MTDAPMTDVPPSHGPGDSAETTITLPAVPAGGYAGHDGQQLLYPQDAHYQGYPEEPVLAGLETREVSAWFGARKVLERVSLAMPAGEVTALIGPSGCGKSTYLRILNRMHEMVRGAALSGEVLLDGDDVYRPGRRPAEVRRRIGMVFQRPNPFPAMSIKDNVASGLKLAGIKVTRDEREHWWRPACARPASGTRWPAGWRPRAARSPAASSSACASRGRWPSRRTSC